MRVLVAGGTGRLGRLVVSRLLERGVTVRVLTRDATRAGDLRDLGAEVVDGDVRKPETLPAALQDVDVVVSAFHGFVGSGLSPESVDRDGNANLVAAAQTAQVAVVLMSVVEAAADSPMVLFRCKAAAEEGLRASGVQWTIVRSAAFIELWAELVGKGIVFGRGENPINFVSVHDVADVVMDAVLDPSRRGQVIDVVGPERLTFNQLADRLRALDGRPRRVRHVPRGMLRLLAPLHRQPKAALVMDTTDMTYRSVSGAHVGPTSPGQALARAAAVR
ncbi:MAG TPA: SDR family oxidoreductase [Marmoricola sp.]|nr:SDR family oxidoreductase [Marmoricola sp.]